ncbi:MAG: hypothetical protein ACFFFG_04340 [Candidatus Thorarchaeota archaeon]
MKSGESISSDNEYILAHVDSSLSEITILGCSGPQGVVISIKGQSKNGFTILQDFEIPMQKNAMFAAYLSSVI